LRGKRGTGGRGHHELKEKSSWQEKDADRKENLKKETYGLFPNKALIQGRDSKRGTVRFLVWEFRGQNDDGVRVKDKGELVMKVIHN